MPNDCKRLSISGAKLPYILKSDEVNFCVVQEYKKLRNLNIPVTGTMLREIGYKIATKKILMVLKLLGVG